MSRREELEQIGRARALSDRESLELEILLAEADGRRLAPATRREAARLGLKRDMSRFAK